MLTYDEALQRVLAQTDPLPAEIVPVADAYGRALTESIVAAENLPPFDNSAVDGFAVGDATYQGGYVRDYAGTVLAGQIPSRDLGSGAAVYVATGAMLPVGTSGIVMVEDTVEGEPAIHGPAFARFIRRAGSDVEKGETVLRAGDVVDAGAVGLLSSLGVTRVSCHSRPRVGILSTGDELVPVTTRVLPPAMIRDSNSHAIEAAALAAGGVVIQRLHAPDDKDAIRNALLSLSGCAVVITSGGVSVGDADFVKGIVEEIGSLDFWRIAIKPGKPLAFGRVGNALFFGLPGNPVSSLVTFELFVRPVLRRLAGHRETSRPHITATLAEPLPHEPGRREFVRARLEYRDGEAFATTTGSQGSHRVSSLVGANALLIAHEDHGDYEVGERLPALLLF
ncbi:MAG: molybdopterin molybdotransferase MoeA [Akkermansiaceae bacterium]|nr:molybdopterin molybdotransferase MoeA [Armatimonadota bacterium]